MNKYVIGDIHGNYKGFLQCLERSNFNKEDDLLITLGDITDGWSEVPECFDELLTINNRIDIRGNHDTWLLEFLETGVAHKIWTDQGGEIVKNRYLELSKSEEGRSKVINHRDKFLKKQHYYYIDESNRLFVHGGFNWKVPIKENNSEDLTWDRHAFQTACMWETHALANPDERHYFKEFKEVFVGHTCTNHGVNWRIGNSLEPIHVTNLWNLDTGSGWDGKLTIMDIDTKEYWQSDLVSELYKQEKGRR